MTRAALAALAALLLAGCGGETDERRIPAERAELLSSTLREVERATADEDCARAQTFLTRAVSRVSELPASVDGRLVAQLQQGIVRLQQLVPKECAPEPEPEPTPTETTETTETAPPAETAPPQETEPPEQTTPPEETAPSEGPPPTPTTPTPAPGGTGGTPGGEGSD